MTPGSAMMEPMIDGNQQIERTSVKLVGEMSDQEIEAELAKNEATRQELDKNPALAPRPDNGTERNEQSDKYADIAALLNRHYELKRERERRSTATQLPAESTPEAAQQ